MRHTFRVDSEIDRQPKLSLEVIDRVIFHDWRGDLPDDHRLVSYFSSDRRVERKEQPSSLTRDGIAVINALFCIGLADASARCDYLRYVRAVARFCTFAKIRFPKPQDSARA
jgi:hypothetical protein